MIKKRHYNWKGDKAKYRAKHMWLASHFGKADRCEFKNCTGKSKQYEWCNISKKYKRIRSDWKRGCKSCHAKFDFTEEKRKKLSLLNKERCGPLSHSWKGGEVKKICKICNKFYFVKRYRIKTAKYCSRKCNYKHYKNI